MVSDLAIGVVASLVGSTVLNLGMNLQKMSINQNPGMPMMKQPLWCIGFSIFLLGNLGDLVALTFASASVIAPLGSISLLSNAVFAPLLVGETFTRSDGIALIMIVGGNILTTSFGNHEQTEYSLADLMGFASTVQYQLYLSAVLITVFAVWNIQLLFQQWKNGEPDSLTPRQKVMLRKCHPLCYPVMGGVTGAQTVLAAKGCGELVKTSLKGENQFLFLTSYVIIFFSFLTAILQIMWINLGLKHFDALFIIPVFFSIWTCFSIVGGMVFFGEFVSFTARQATPFFLGLLITLMGVYFLSKREIHPAVQVTPEDPNATDLPPAGAYPKPAPQENSVAMLPLQNPIYQKMMVQDRPHTSPPHSPPLAPSTPPHHIRPNSPTSLPLTPSTPLSAQNFTQAPLPPITNQSGLSPSNGSLPPLPSTLPPIQGGRLPSLAPPSIQSSQYPSLPLGLPPSYPQPSIR